MFFLALSFLAGALTALAPCTISLLPVIVGGSLSGGTSKKRALVVTASLGVSVILFTFLLKVSTVFINVPPSFWSVLSGVIVTLLGIAMIFPQIWDAIPFLNRINQDSNRLLATGYQKQNLLGDILVGAALGPVFSSCSPTYFLILATVLPASFALGFVYLVAYAIGLCGLLLVITLAGQKLLETLGVASDPYGWFKRSIGVLLVIVGLAIVFGVDKKLQVALSGSIFDETRIEQMLLSKQGGDMPEKLDTLNTADISETATMEERLGIKMMRYERAPEITNPSGFLNTGGKPVTLGEYRGKKVVLVDFWTYSCINCKRTTPYLNAWYEKYKDQGLEIVGIHTPEFAFEHVIDNVARAIGEEKIKYPVVLDNDYATWGAFKNSYWPRKYLVDIDGYIVYDHAGEGDYDITELEIQKALAERARVLKQNEAVAGGIVTPSEVTDIDFGQVGSPETYFGSSRNQYLGNGSVGKSGVQTFAAPKNMSRNRLYLSGSWNIQDEYAESGGAGAILYTYKAKNVYLVMSSEKEMVVTVLLDGKEIRKLTVHPHTLYPIVEGTDYAEHTLEIRVPAAGLEAYAFTFG